MFQKSLEMYLNKHKYFEILKSDSIVKITYGTGDLGHFLLFGLYTHIYIIYIYIYNIKHSLINITSKKIQIKLLHPKTFNINIFFLVQDILKGEDYPNKVDNLKIVNC